MGVTTDAERERIWLGCDANHRYRLGVPRRAPPMFSGIEDFSDELRFALEPFYSIVLRLGQAIAKVEIGLDGGTVRSGRGRSRHFTLEQVDRFHWHWRVDGGYCVLLLSDGREVPVRSVPEHQQGQVAALNNRLLRAQRDATP